MTWMHCDTSTAFPSVRTRTCSPFLTPPHYTAYPNPHIAEFIERWGNPYDETTDDYHREPFVSDVSEGKGGAIYNAHTYHTKVPYKAIIPFIQHYTEPGDIVFDGFCAPEPTGSAATHPSLPLDAAARPCERLHKPV